MLRSVSIKAAVLAPILFATWFVTSTIMAQYPRAKKAVATEPSVTKAGSPNPQALPSNARPFAPDARFRLKEFAFAVEDGGVRVDAAVDLADRRGKFVYLWRVRSYLDGADGPAIDLPYVTQIFEVDATARMAPTFSDTLKLPSGIQRVMLTLHAIEKDSDPAALEDKDVSEATTVIRASRQVTIP